MRAVGIPGGLELLERAFSLAGSPRVTRGQDGSVVEPSLSPPDAGPVLAETLLTVPQAAARMRCSTSTVKRRIRGQLLPTVRNGRLVRIRVRDIDDFLGD